MTPQEKAKERVDKYLNLLRKAEACFANTTDEINKCEKECTGHGCPLWIEYAKKCVLIEVNEILNEFPQGFKGNFEAKRKAYWQQVKQEIEKL